MQGSDVRHRIKNQKYRSQAFVRHGALAVLFTENRKVILEQKGSGRRGWRPSAPNLRS